MENFLPLYYGTLFVVFVVGVRVGMGIANKAHLENGATPLLDN